METLLEGEEMGIKSVEQDKEPAVLDPMMAVLQKLLSVQNGVTVSVLPISLVDLSVDLDLIILLVQDKIHRIILKMLTLSMTMRSLMKIRNQMKIK